MKKYLLLIKIMILSGGLFADAETVGVISFDETGIAKYNLVMSYKDAGITGLCYMRCDSLTVKGSVINEFGVKAFDFIFERESDKLKLQNVIGFFNKWYIKRTIKSDWSKLFKQQNKKSKTRLNVKNDTITLDNTKRKIKYTLVPQQ